MEGRYGQVRVREFCGLKFVPVPGERVKRAQAVVEADRGVLVALQGGYIAQAARAMREPFSRLELVNRRKL